MEREVIVMRESLLQSILSDTYKFGSMFFMLYSNHRWFGDHAVVALAFVAMIVFMTMTWKMAGERVFHSTEAAITHLKRLHE